MSKGMRFEKIHQGQILKGLNSWELGNRSSESSKGTQLDLVGQRTLCDHAEDKIGVGGNLFILLDGTKR